MHSLQFEIVDFRDKSAYSNKRKCNFKFW